MLMTRPAAAALSLSLLSVTAASAQQDRGFLGSGAQDKPRVAIIQYESGRILVVHEVNGELQAVEPASSDVEVLRRYLSTKTRPVTAQAVPPSASGDPLFFSPYWYGLPYAYGNHDNINTNEHGDRRTERLEQRAAEARQQVIARRRESGTTSITNSAGRVYPLTAAEQEQRDRLGAAGGNGGGNGGGSAGDYGDDPFLSFYSLGLGLEEYRQQEIAARKELALLSYDALLREGLDYFHNRRYGQAARSFIGAAQKDHGDAASRLHAAQALMASGLHREAMVHVRRAFELAPALIHRPLDHAASYTFAQDYEAHVRALEDHVVNHPDDLDALVLLAYQRFFSENPSNARDAMREVKNRALRDPFARKMVAAAEPVLGRL